MSPTCPGGGRTATEDRGTAPPRVCSAAALHPLLLLLRDFCMHILYIASR